MTGKLLATKCITFVRSILIATTVVVTGFSQGTIVLATYIPGNIDARATFPNGEPVGSDYTGQLYAGPAGTPLSALSPVFPTRGLTEGYVLPIGLTVPGVNPGELATVVVRVYKGGTWETSDCRGESQSLTLKLTGSGGSPDTTLDGIQPFTVTCVPEPTATGLFILGAFLVLMLNSKQRVLGSLCAHP